MGLGLGLAYFRLSRSCARVAARGGRGSLGSSSYSQGAREELGEKEEEQEEELEEELEEEQEEEREEEQEEQQK